VTATSLPGDRAPAKAPPWTGVSGGGAARRGALERRTDRSRGARARQRVRPGSTA